MKLTREEMETHLYFNAMRDCTVCISTFSSRLKRKIKAAAEQFDDVIIKKETEDGELIAEFPKKLLSLSVKTKKSTSRGKSLTEEQKRAFVERTQKARKAIS